MTKRTDKTMITANGTMTAAINNKTHRAQGKHSPATSVVKRILTKFESEVRTVMHGFFGMRTHFNNLKLAKLRMAFMTVLALVMVFGASVSVDAATVTQTPEVTAMTSQYSGNYSFPDTSVLATHDFDANAACSGAYTAGAYPGTDKTMTYADWSAEVYLDWGFDDSAKSVTMRWPSTAVSAGSTINAAYLYIDGYADGGWAGGNNDITLEYSVDGTNWTTFISATNPDGDVYYATTTSNVDSSCATMQDSEGFEAVATVLGTGTATGGPSGPTTGLDVTTQVQAMVDNGSYNGNTMYWRLSAHAIGQTGRVRSFTLDMVQMHIDYTGAPADATPPAEVGNLAVAPESGTYVPDPFTITMDFTDNESAVTSCRYTINGGTSWIGGTVGGTGPTYTCTASGVSAANGTAMTIQMRATSTGGESTEVATLNRTVDSAAPTDGTLTQNAGNGQVDLSWTAASDAGSGLTAANTYKLVKATGGTPPADCSGAAIYQGTALTYLDTAVTNGTTYSYRVCATDNLGHVSSGATASATPSLDCTVGAPTVNISTAPQTITIDGGNAVYDFTVTNNDSGADCSSVTFNLVAGDSNGTDFVTPSSLSTGTVTLAAGATSAAMTVTVTAQTGATSGSNTTMITASEAGHTDGSDNIVTDINVPLCQANTPTLLVSPLQQSVDAGNSVNYTITVVNNDTVDCTATTFDINLISDSNGTDFDASSILPLTLNLNPGASGNATLTVTAQAGAPDAASNDTTVGVSATGHTSPTDVTVTTNVGNPLLHNSVNTGSTKWSGDGGWGINGGKYGKFVCETCHEPHSDNIKGLKLKITVPDTSKGDIPSTATANDVAVSTIGDYGNDSDSHTSSNRVCEVCHSITDYHRYDTTGQVDFTHKNASDCTTCHQHNKAFAPSACNECHGDPPVIDVVETGTSPTAGLAWNPVATGSTTAGAHDTHVNTLGFSCNNCHNGYTMPNNGDIDISFANWTSTNGTYAGQTSVVSYSGGGAGTPDDSLACSAVYCHGGTLGGSSPAWTDASVACGDCHEAVSPTLGSHTQHVSTLGMACDDCHGTGAGGTAAHVSGTVSWNLTNIDAGAQYRGSNASTTGDLAPSPTYGDCSNVYCHGSALSGGADIQPTWGGSVTCGDCHAVNNTLPDSHSAHYSITAQGDSASDSDNSTSTNYVFQCGACHNGVAHVDTSSPVDVAISATYGGSFAAGDCSNVYCHGNFPGNGNNATPTWGSAASGACGTCHDVDTSATMSGGSHDKHVKTVGLTCDYCHSQTAVNEAGGILDKSVHANGMLTWNLDETKGEITATSTYRGANSGEIVPAGAPYGTCDNIYCHSNVQSSPPGSAVTYKQPQWGLTVNCGDCHDAGPVGGAIEQSSGSHLTHVSASEYHIACSQCHEGAGSGSANHANSQVNVAINATWGGSYDGTATPGDAYGSCSSVYCHSDGKSTPTYASPAWGNTGEACTFCHGGAGGSTGGAGTALSSSHAVHTDPAGIAYTCDDCHSTVASDNATIGTHNLHVNNERNVSVALANGGDGNDFAGGTCSTTNCHGSVSPDWTAGGTTGDCSLCHGMAADPNDGRDTNGDTDPADFQVGAHVVHLTNASGFGAAITCNTCHTDPNDTAGTYAQKMATAGHMNGTALVDMTGNGRANGQGLMTPSYTAPGCATWCHGSNLADGTDNTPDWTQTGYLPQTGVKDLANCSVCHGAPPASKSVHNGMDISTDCSGCHGHNGFGPTHIDGNLTGGGNCDSCHGYPPAIGDTKDYRTFEQEGKGAHPQHVANLVNAWGGTLDPANDQFGSGASWTNVCGVCHNGAVHNMSEAVGGTGRTIAFPSSLDAGGTATYEGVVGQSSNPATDNQLKSCSSTLCHFKESPGWQDHTTAGN